MKSEIQQIIKKLTESNINLNNHLYWYSQLDVNKLDSKPEIAVIEKQVGNDIIKVKDMLRDVDIILKSYRQFMSEDEIKHTFNIFKNT